MHDRALNRTRLLQRVLSKSSRTLLGLAERLWTLEIVLIAGQRLPLLVPLLEAVLGSLSIGSLESGSFSLFNRTGDGVHHEPFGLALVLLRIELELLLVRLERVMDLLQERELVVDLVVQRSLLRAFLHQVDSQAL